MFIVFEEPARVEGDFLYVTGFCKHELIEAIENEDFRASGYTRLYKCCGCGYHYNTDDYRGFEVLIGESIGQGTPIERLFPCQRCGKVDDYYIKRHIKNYKHDTKYDLKPGSKIWTTYSKKFKLLKPQEKVRKSYGFNKTTEIRRRWSDRRTLSSS